MEGLFFAIGFLLGGVFGVADYVPASNQPLRQEGGFGGMRKRNVHVQFWLDKKEAEAFNKKVKRSGLSREAYLRHLVNGLVPQDAPPPAYFDFIRELHGIGNNLNQIAQKAHVLGVIDERRYEEETRKFDQLIRDITRAVILPKPME